MQLIRGRSSYAILVLLGSLAPLGSMVGQVPAYPRYPPPAASAARVQYMSGEISWAQCDLEGVIGWASRAFPGHRLTAVGHSFGETSADGE